MKIRSISVPTSTTKVVKDSHHADILSLPCDNNSPKLGVVDGTPKPENQG